MTPIRVCAEPSCPSPAMPGKARCVTHAAERHRASRSVNDRFYSSHAWRRQRERQLFEHPLCEYELEDGSLCGAIADSVHHRIPIEDGGARRDPANLLSVCRPHHSQIHAQRRGAPAAEKTAREY